MAKRNLSMWIRCPGKKPVKLEPGQRLRIGRHESNDLVLNNGTVSRFHAVLMWDPDEDRPYVRDNESANGVEVNGQVVDERRHLNGGDSVGVGDFSLSLELRSEDTRPDRAALDSSSGDDEVTLFADKGKEVQGEVDDLRALQRLFLGLEEQKRTGTLQMTCDGDLTGTVLFSQGKIMSVEAGPLTGREALKKLLLQGRAKYHFSKAVTPTEAAEVLSVQHFLSEEFGFGTERVGK